MEIKDFILKFSKKISFSKQDISRIIELLKFDKKNKDENARFVLLKEIGKPSFDNLVEIKDIMEAFQFYDN